MLDVQVINDPEAARSSLDPVRARMLAALVEPGSATTLAAQAGLSRQKANYHLRALERHGLVELVEERRKGNMTERVMVATASSYVISPTALAAVAPDPDRAPDQLSARWMLALAARLVREVGDLITGATTAGQPLATFAIDTELEFATASDRAAFAQELTDAVNRLAGKYHDQKSHGGRTHRLVVALHPSLISPPEPLTRTQGARHRAPDQNQYRTEGAVSMGHEFTIRREVALPATPEQVFAAITTGTAGWMFPIDDIVGPGGAGPDNPVVTRWEPPNEFSVRMEGQDGWFNALEYLIEARDGGTCVLRYVHSGIFVDDWEGQYEGADKHTTFYLHSLGQYVQHFSGRPVTYVAVNGPSSAAGPDALEVLGGALGLTETGGAGEKVRLVVPGLDPIEAVVDYRTSHFIGLRSDDALYRFYGRNAFGGQVDAAHHLFAEGVDKDATKMAWQTWLHGVYA